MNAAERLAVLRDILFAEPSEAIWTQILGLYEDWDYRDDLAVGIDYALGPLANWPDDLRVAPVVWSRVMLGEPKYLIKRRWERGKRTHPAMKLVRHLDLSARNGLQLKIGPKALKLLAKAKPLQWITRLRLDNHRFGDDGTYELSEATHLGSVAHLHMRNCGLGPQGIWDLIEGEGGLMEGLQTLDLHYNSIGDEGARGLARCAGLISLESLDLGNCRIEDAGWRALADAEVLMGLKHIRAGGSYDSTWTTHLLDARFAPNLESLGLVWGSQSSRALEIIMGADLPALTGLDISGVSCDERLARRFGNWVREQGLTHIKADHVGDVLRALLLDLAADTVGLTLEARQSST